MHLVACGPTRICASGKAVLYWCPPAPAVYAAFPRESKILSAESLHRSELPRSKPQGILAIPVRTKAMRIRINPEGSSPMPRSRDAGGG